MSTENFQNFKKIFSAAKYSLIMTFGFGIIRNVKKIGRL